jgi:hypothetical protein
MSYDQDVDKIAAKAKELAAHSWEYGAVSHALLEVYDPTLSPFFGDNYGVADQLISNACGLTYAKDFIHVDQDELCDGEGK